MTSVALTRFYCFSKAQWIHLIPVITIGEQLIDVILAHKKYLIKQAHDRAVVLLGTVGIHGDRMSSFPHQPSEGCVSERYCDCFGAEPKLIIMDEPTTAPCVVEREIFEWTVQGAEE